jgi:hypothetical protein
MSRGAPRKFAILLALAIGCSTARGSQTPSHKELTAQHSRIQALLIQLAEQARALNDLALAVRAQAQAATLLWPYEPERSRTIFRRAFDTLSTADDSEKSGASSSVAQSRALTRRTLRTELLNQIAALDAELVEELVRKLSVKVDSARDQGSGFGEASLSSRSDSSQREMFVSLALQVVEREPARAMTLGQLSLGSTVDKNIVPPNFTRLLMLMRATDRSLARLLFSTAVDRLQRSTQPSLVDIQALSSYLASSESVSGSDTADAKEVQRFLRLALERIVRYRDRAPEGSSGISRTARLEDKSAIYFIGRQLSEFFARHLPGRLAQLKSRVAELTESPAGEPIVDSLSIEAIGPADVARQARTAPEGRERDDLYAKAALSWLAQGEVVEAQSSALKIGAVAIRDKVLTQIGRRRTTEGQVEDAALIARTLEDPGSRAALLVAAAGAALAAPDRVRATELLNEAEVVGLKTERPIERAHAMLTVANSFAGFDTVRAFEVMQSAVRSLNQAFLAPDDLKQPADAPQLGNSTLYRLGLEETLASLARADFDGALLLAQQLSSKDASVIAQLAVCDGGLDTDARRRIDNSAEAVDGHPQ